MSIQACETCDFLQMDQQEAYCVRCKLRKYEVALQKIATGVPGCDAECLARQALGIKDDA